MNNLEKTTMVKVTFRCDPKYKKKLIGSSCIIHVSVGQEYHEGEKFLATMDLINETFDSCHLIVCDTLQRHTLKVLNPALSDEEAAEQARKKGNEWLERNKQAYQNLKINLQISRWDEWLSHPRYTDYRQTVQNIYDNNTSSFKDSVHETVKRFIERQKSSNRLLIDEDRAKISCINYILEESPVLIPLWAETNTKFVIYPRFRTPAMASAHEYFIGKDKELLLEVALKFNPRVIPKRLSFI